MRNLFRNKFTCIVAMTLVCAMSLSACGNKNTKPDTESKKAVQDATESTQKAEKTEKIALSDGTYTAEFTTEAWARCRTLLRESEILKRCCQT